MKPGVQVGLVADGPAWTGLDEPLVLDQHLGGTSGILQLRQNLVLSQKLFRRITYGIVLCSTGKLVPLGGALELKHRRDADVAEGIVVDLQSTVVYCERVFDGFQTAPCEVLST